MEKNALDQRLVEHWRSAAEDLGIRVTAPVELRDASGAPFQCEAYVQDFGSTTGAYVVSAKTERRVRQNLRTLNDLWVCRSGPTPGSYERKHFMSELLDWGWFGEQEAEPRWYAEKVPSSG